MPMCECLLSEKHARRTYYVRTTFNVERCDALPTTAATAAAVALITGQNGRKSLS